MQNKISTIIDSLGENTIENISINNDEKIINVKFISCDKKERSVQFSSVETYFFLDENMIKDVDEPTSIKSLDASSSEIIAVQGMEDGSFIEQTIASPNIMLTTKTTSMLLVAKQIVVDGESFLLDQILN